MSKTVSTESMLRWSSRACFGVAALVTVLLALNAYERFSGGMRFVSSPPVVEDDAAEAPGQQDSATMASRGGGSHGRNIFAPPQRRPKLLGVLGNQAIFDNNQLFSVGQSIQDAKIVAIGADSVTLEVDGEEEVLMLFGGRPPSTNQQPARPARRATATPGLVAPRAGSPAASSTLTPEHIERFRQMPAETRQQMLERMPAEMAQQLRDAL